DIPVILVESERRSPCRSALLEGRFLTFEEPVPAQEVPPLREYSVPATFQVTADENLVTAVYENAREVPDAVGFRRRDAEKQWHARRRGGWRGQRPAVARGLIAAGINPGDRVALLSHTRYEWTLLDYAILAVGGVTVPIYETSSADQIGWILSDSGAVGVIVE